MKDYFSPENILPEYRREAVSDSGVYKIVTDSYRTTEGGWTYTRGCVYRVGSDEPIADIRRNYSEFPYSFIEDHPNGHPFFVCGADYQGQTIIELDTGRRRDFLPEEAKEGFGFCWVDHRFDAATQLLIVEGCIWAAPWEYRFYDFSDPMGQGWPELDHEGTYAGQGKWPEISPDGLIRTFDADPAEDDASDEDPPGQHGWAEINTYRRCGGELRFVSKWLSAARQERNRRQAQAERAHEAWEREFKSSDPLYLEYLRQVTQPGLSPEMYESRGITYEQWCPTFEGSETRWCRRIVKDGRYQVDLEWGVLTGPIKLVFYDNGKYEQPVFFDHSANGMAEAFAFAKSKVAGERK